MRTLKVLSYNVRSLRDDPDAVARVMRAAAPDVALIQEAPRFLRWRSACAALARRAGLVWVCGGRSTGANLLLSTLAVRTVQRFDIPFSDLARLHHRGAAVALLELAGARFAVAGTHLDLIEAPRLAHLQELASFAERQLAGVPLVVGGDLNAVPGSLTWQRCARFGEDAWTAAAAAQPGEAGGTSSAGPGGTYPAGNPVRRIDAVFADARLPVLRAEVLDSPDVRVASDHRPLLVELQLN